MLPSISQYMREPSVCVNGTGSGGGAGLLGRPTVAPAVDAIKTTAVGTIAPLSAAATSRIISG
jgi:hypothetical protein